MAIVGAYARIDIKDPQVVQGRLDALEGVETFDLDAPGTIGLVIEAEGLDAAHDAVSQVVAGTVGVLGVWPVFVHTEDLPSGPEDTKATEEGVE